MRYWRRASRAADTARHTAHGVEITSHEIRLVRLSRVVGRTGPGAARGDHVDIQVDDAVRHPLPPGIVAGADIVDAEALSRALEACLSRQAGCPARHATPDGAMRIALALCPSVVTQGTVALDELIPGFSMRLPGRLDEAAFDALEPWVSLHAQRISGIDPGEMIVDWHQVASGDPERVVVAASQKHYLDIRQGVADAAGVRLGALCDASIAALDACRFVVARCLHTRCDDVDVMSPPPVIGGTCFSPASTSAPQPQRRPRAVRTTWGDASAGSAAPAPEAQRLVAEARRVYAGGDGGLSHVPDTPRFAALWLGERAWRAWAFAAAGEMLEEWMLPDVRDPAALIATLHERKGPLALALVAGECDALAAVGGLRAVGGALRCPAIEFDASACCVGPAATSHKLGPATAVAFGLAVRELLQ